MRACSQSIIPPSVPAEAGCLFAVVAGVVFISGESLHCFLVGWCANKSYVIATSDLRLFIHASDLLPLLPTPLPYNIFVFVFVSLAVVLQVLLFHVVLQAVSEPCRVP